jgi:formiminoglutamase
MQSTFTFIDEAIVSTLLIKREGEVRIGEVVRVGSVSIQQSLEGHNGKYVVLGVEEDIGPRANGGLGGAKDAFKAFLTKFLNMQANSFFEIDELLLLGYASFESQETDLSKLRLCVNEMDTVLTDILSQILQAGKTPILVGGGHNNAYPLIQAYSTVFKKQLNVINLDPHADFRALEGRHSGNSFSYAMKMGYLKTYTIHGLHKAYNSEDMLIRMKQSNVEFTTYESYLDDENELMNDANLYVKKNVGDFAVELDLDSIANMPSSAMSPSGWAVNEARTWLRILHKASPVYYHFTEGAPSDYAKGDSIVGKTLAYLVADILEKK